jgi:hypothetical protein
LRIPAKQHKRKRCLVIAGVRYRGTGDDENGLLALVIFSSVSCPGWARNLCEMVRKVQHSMDKCNPELAFEEDQEPHHRELEVTLGTCWPN